VKKKNSADTPTELFKVAMNKIEVRMNQDMSCGIGQAGNGNLGPYTYIESDCVV
jgi:hypothetical protein